MNLRVTFHTDAEQELYEAAGYYNAETPGLGNSFLDDVEHAIGQLVQYPESSPLVNKLVRRKPLRRFPYNVMYTVLPGAIRIVAVANQKRRPFYWRGRV